MINIRVNGTTISLENSNVVTSDNIDNQYKSIESLFNQIDNMYTALRLISNVKAVESFGYISTESVGESIKAGASKVWEAIKNFFIKIGKWFRAIWEAISGKRRKELIKECSDKQAEINSLNKKNDDISQKMKSLQDKNEELLKHLKDIEISDFNKSADLAVERQINDKSQKEISRYRSAMNVISDFNKNIRSFDKCIDQALYTMAINSTELRQTLFDSKYIIDLKRINDQLATKVLDAYNDLSTMMSLEMKLIDELKSTSEFNPKEYVDEYIKEYVDRINNFEHIVEIYHKQSSEIRSKIDQR